MIKHQNKIIVAQKALGMRAKNTNGELRSTVVKQEAMTALQQNEFHATTAQQAKELKTLTTTLKEQALQSQKVSDRLEHLKPTKKDLMISKIISGAACLAELTSNPKSFYNCPDLHGGVPGLPGGKNLSEARSR
jgi:plasmid replication initiation protein